MPRNDTAPAAFWRSLCGGMHAIPTLRPSEWATQHRIMSRGVSAQPGRFVALPMQIAPMDDAVDPEVAEIVLCFAAQTAGKTEILFNLIGFFIHADPSPQLYVQPTDKLAADYSKERIAPMLRDTPVLAALVAAPRTRDSGNTVLSKTYLGGSIVFVGANSPAGLAGRPRRVILQDEIDRYPASAGTEGDPCALADRRAESFPNAVKVKTSTPTLKDQSRIWSLLEQSDFQQWHARCPHCQAEQVFKWAQLGWPDDKPEEAWIECAAPTCKAKLTDAERVAAVRAGRWKPTRPFKGLRGYWLNGINTLFRKQKGYRNRLHQMAADFLKAKAGGPSSLRVWVNTFLAECWEEPDTAAVSPDELTRRGEPYAPDELPVGALLLTAGVDVQNDRLECEVVAWGRDEESWGVAKKVFDGDPESDEVWQNLDAFLLSEFKRADGLVLAVERVFVDMQHKTKRVLEFCAPRIARGVYPCRGINRAGPAPPPLLPAKPSRNNRLRLPHWNVGVTIAKGTLYDRLPLPTPGPRSLHFPEGHGYDEDHFRQITCEKRRRRYASGVAYDIFEKAKASDRNEALDLRVYAFAALASLGKIRWDKLAANRLAAVPAASKDIPEPAAAVPTEPPPDPRPPPRRTPRRNFATSW